jgi:hypothetical protein
MKGYSESVKKNKTKRNERDEGGGGRRGSAMHGEEGHMEKATACRVWLTSENDDDLQRSKEKLRQLRNDSIRLKS